MDNNKIKTAEEVDKEIEEVCAKVDISKFPITKLFDEKSHLRNYKFNDDEIKKIISNFECQVDMRLANILHRLEQYFRERIGEPNKHKMKPESRAKILRRAMSEYNRKGKHYDRRQEYRQIDAAKIKLERSILNRVKYFELLDLNVLGNRNIPNETIEQEDTFVNNEENDNELYQFSFNLTDVQNYEIKKNITGQLLSLEIEGIDLNQTRSELVTCSQHSSEPIVSYTDFQNLTLATSTQQQQLLPENEEIEDSQTRYDLVTCSQQSSESIASYKHFQKLTLAISAQQLPDSTTFTPHMIQK